MQTSNALINVLPKGRPAHISLDFDRLRAEGVRHLENLATEIWTDFNAHDPGITLLELLCYAITDLGYRTHKIPIQDIATGKNGEKPWFEAHEILPVSPVTAFDLRKILIDMEGVKNAWLERAKPQDLVIKDVDGNPAYLKKIPEYRLKTLAARQANSTQWVAVPDEINTYAASIEPLKIMDPATSKETDNPAYKALVEKLTKLVNLTGESLINEVKLLSPKIQPDAFLCAFGHFYQEQTEKLEEALLLNGVYRILLELDDHLDPASEKVRKRITRRALRRLHQDRGLCQDYLTPEVVQSWCYCLCLDIEVEANVNEKEVAAEILYRIQEFLLPSVRSYTFKEMRQRGLHCDEIFNGPLLSNGFIAEDELIASAKLPRYIYRSDLQRIASETPGVLDVRDLRIKTPGTQGKYSDEWQIKVVPEDYPDNLTPPGNLKPLLDACCSKVNTHRNGLVQALTGRTLEDPYNTLRMERQSLAKSNLGGPEAPAGMYREDLSDYVSVQYDLPGIYGVGPNQPRPGHLYASRQLQAYLLFYDQILAGYLAQLGQVKRLFSVNQNPAEPTMVLQPLFDVPGAKELMGDFADLFFPPDVISAAEYATAYDKSEGENALVSLQVQLSDTQDPELKKALESRKKELGAYLEALENMPANLKPLVGKTFNGLSELRASLEQAMGPAHFAAYSLAVENAVWQYFIGQKNNNLVLALGNIADPSARRQERRNRLLDHLIARFGESFSEYVAVLARPDADPEDNPWRQDYSEYLRDKARFLQSLHTTGAERGRAFNYRLLNQWEQPDVWNTDNVSGIQKRVCRLLGIDSFHTRSLLGTLPYRVEVMARSSRQGAPVYYVQLERREDLGGKQENPLRPGPLMISKPLKNKETAEQFRLEVYQNIWREGNLLPQTKKGDFVHAEVYFNYTFKDSKGQIVDHGLKSAPKPEEAIDTFLSDLKDLVKPQSAQDKEGFHLIEHILLRPDDRHDELLQLSLGCTPAETPRDPYSFWLTVVLPKEAGRFEYTDFQQFVEQAFRRETPAHLALRFCWLSREELLEFEPLFEAWLEAKARCTPDECHVTAAANALILWLNEHPCSCNCEPESESKPCA